MAQATGDLKSVPDGVKAAEISSENADSVVGDAASPVPSVVQVEGNRSSVSMVLSSDGDDADLVPLCKQVQELQAESDDLLSRRAREKKLQMDTFLKHCTEKKKSSEMASEVEKLTKLLAESRLERENFLSLSELRRTLLLRGWPPKNVLRNWHVKLSPRRRLMLRQYKRVMQR